MEAFSNNMYIKNNKGSCEVFISPAVYVKDDTHNYVEPDIHPFTEPVKVGIYEDLCLDLRSFA